MTAANDLLTEAIKEAYSTAPADEVILHTLEFRHPTFTEPVRIVNDFGALLETATEYGGLDIYGHLLTLEESAEENAGEAVKFVGTFFRMELPELAENRLPEVRVTVDNVSQDIMQYMDAAVESESPISLTYREYLLGAPTVVQFKLSGLNIHKVSSTTSTLTATAVFADLTNKAFPNRFYRPDEFPGLLQ